MSELHEQAARQVQSADVLTVEAVVDSVGYENSRLKDEPNGHGTRPGDIEPGIVFVPGGLRSYAETLAGIDDGVLIDRSMGAWAGNPYGGRVTGNVSLGYRIEKGKLTGRIKNVMFSLNAFTHLSDHLTDISSDTEVLDHSALPYMLFD